MFLGTLTTASCACLLAATGAVAYPCGVAGYTPPAVSERLLGALAAVDIAALPATIDVAVLPVNRITLVRGSAIVGQVSELNDVRTGHVAFSAFDAAGHVLMAVHDDLMQACLPSPNIGQATTCRIVSAATELLPVAADGTAPLVVEWPLGGGYPSYFLQGQPVDRWTWEGVYDQALAWLQGTYATTTLTTSPVTATAEAQTFWGLAGDPQVAPLLAGLTFAANAAGTVVITGVVPSSAAFDLVVQRLIAVGLTAFDPEMVIDTGLPVAAVPGPGAWGCAVR